MATLTEFVDTLLDTTDVKSVTLRVLARKLQEAGLVNVWGRGGYAAHMDSEAAASLVVATAIMGTAKDIGVRVERLFAVKAGGGCRTTFSRVPPGMDRSDFIGTFKTALCAVMERADRSMLVSLEIKQPQGSAELTFEWYDNHKLCRSSFFFGDKYVELAKDTKFGRGVTYTMHPCVMRAVMRLMPLEPIRCVGDDPVIYDAMHADGRVDLTKAVLSAA